jgi:large subunit ribosomal protein L9
MKVLLIKDVYNLGRAGDIKKVANGYGRNYLIPQELAILATPGALKQVDQIRSKASTNRDALNQELSGLAQQLSDLVLEFATKAGETGKLYGSITTQNIAAAIKEKINVEVDRREIETQAIRTLGTHKVAIRLTMDLMPEVTVVVRREGEAVIETPADEVAEAEATAISDSGVESETESGVVDIPAAEAEAPANTEAPAEQETTADTEVEAPAVEEAVEAEPEDSDK